MVKYPSFYDALTEIPHLMIFPTGSLFYKGKDDVVLLLNGVETTPNDLRTLPKEDVAKVKVYTIPPVRFANRNISAVINVITRNNLTGGSMGINVDQAPYPTKGDNSIATSYNYKRSRFTLSYVNTNKFDTEYRLSQNLEYAFDGKDYFKHKKGLDSKNQAVRNSVNFTFTNNLSDDYTYDARAGYEDNRQRGTNKQEIFIPDQAPFRGSNTLNTSYTSFFASNYIEKQLGDGGSLGTVLATVAYRRYNTEYLSNYTEYATLQPVGTPKVDETSHYTTHLDAVNAEFQYSLAQHEWGTLGMSATEVFKKSRYVDTAHPFSQTTNSLGMNVQYVGGFGP